MNIFLQKKKSQTSERDEATVLANESQNAENSFHDSQETESSFSLMVNEQKGFNDSEDDVVYDSDDSAKRNIKTKSLFSVAKRKICDTDENQTSSKCSKLDNWLTRPSGSKINEFTKKSNNESDSTKKNSTKNLFVFPGNKKVFEKNSKSLFVDFPKTYNQKQDHGNSSHSLFNSNESENKLVTLDSKLKDSVNRKRSLDPDLSTEHFPVSKKFNLEGNNLFKFSSDIKTSKSKISDSLFEFENSNVTDSVINKTKVRGVSKNDEITASLPELSNTVNLSQFIDISTKLDNVDIKAEPSEQSLLVKEVFNKTIVHTVPMIKNKLRENVLKKNSNNPVINFKKFSKKQRQKNVNIVLSDKMYIYNGRHENIFPGNELIIQE